MDRLNFNLYIHDKENNNSFQGKANIKDINQETKKGTQYIGKFFIKPKSGSKNRLYFQQAELTDSKDYKNLEYDSSQVEVKNQVIDKHVVDYRVKNFLHFGSYGFITFGNTRTGPSVLLTHMMNEETETSNPNYHLNIGITPSLPAPPFIPVIPIPTQPVEFIVIDDVKLFGNE